MYIDLHTLNTQGLNLNSIHHSLHNCHFLFIDFARKKHVLKNHMLILFFYIYKHIIYISILNTVLCTYTSTKYTNIHCLKYKWFNRTAW